MIWSLLSAICLMICIPAFSQDYISFKVVSVIAVISCSILSYRTIDERN